MSQDAGARFGRGYRTYFLALSVAISAFAVIDRTALLTMGQSIKADLKLSDLQFGVISGFGYALFYAVLGGPIARIADTRSRAKLIAVAVAVFSVFAALCGLARSFIQLMLCRVTVGVGEAGVNPPTYSMISDLYPPQRRGTALAILSIGIPVGTLIGPVLAGYLAKEFSWRLVYLLLGVPGLLLALLAFLTLREPPRGLSENRVEADQTPAPDFYAIVRYLAAKPTFWMLVTGMMLTTFAAAGIGSFLPQYFGRVFHLGLDKVGWLFGGVSFLSTLVGNVSGGVTADWLSKRDKRWYAWLPAIGLGVSAPLYAATFLSPNPVTAIVLLTLAGAVLFLYYAPVQVIVQNMVEPRMRGRATFIFTVASFVLGFGFGGALQGWLSDVLAARALGIADFQAQCPGGVAVALGSGLDCQGAAATGLRGAMTVMSAFFLWAAIHFALASRTIRKDLVV
jgi:MFS family permease